MSLRERKKAAAMRHIQSVALDLFDEFGYDVVTIEMVAERAEVSQSTVYRYFKTKEGLLIRDEYDDAWLQFLLQRLPDHPVSEVMHDYIAALEAYMEDEFDRDSGRRMRYYREVPSVRGASYLVMDEMCDDLSETLANRRIGPALTQTQARVIAHALVFGMFAALEHWWYDREQGLDRPLTEVLREAVEAMSELTAPLDSPRPDRS